MVILVMANLFFSQSTHLKHWSSVQFAWGGAWGFTLGFNLHWLKTTPHWWLKILVWVLASVIYW